MSHSPVLFESDEEHEDSADREVEVKTEAAPPSPRIIKDEIRVRNLKQILSGVPPPPIYTTPEIDVNDLLIKWRDYNETLSLSNKVDSSLERASSPVESFCHQDNSVVVVEKNYWTYNRSEAFKVGYHDVYYNVGAVSEELASLIDRYRERFVGSETGSSFIRRSPILTASAKKRARQRARGGFSPGRRLSHLAQRRRTFSSANLSLYSTNLNGKAILPGSLNNNKSAVTKKIIMVDTKSKNFQKSKSTTKHKELNKMKRALFQSPDQICKSTSCKEKTTRVTPLKTKVSKRALWPSSEKKTRLSAKKITPKKIVIEDSDEAISPEEIVNANGKRISSSNDIGPVKKKCQKSLNFCSENSVMTVGNQTCVSSQVENVQHQLQNQQLSKLHKQKMLWAVASSLKQCGISTSHELFRPAGTVLFKKCRQIWIQMLNSKNFAVKRSTSEQMFEIAVKYAPETVKKLKSSNSNCNVVSSLPGDNFVNITKITNEEKNRTPGFSKVSDIFFSNSKTSVSLSQTDSSDQESGFGVAKLCAAPLLRDSAESNSNSLSHASSDVSFSHLKSNETVYGINGAQDLSNSNTDDSIEKNLRLMFEGNINNPSILRTANSINSSSKEPKIFDEESQAPLFNINPNQTDNNAKSNISPYSSSVDLLCSISPKKTMEPNVIAAKNVVKVGSNSSLHENDSGFIDNDVGNCYSAQSSVKPYISSSCNNINCEITSDTHSLQIHYEVQSPISILTSSSSRDTTSKFDKNKENHPLISTKSIDSSLVLSKEPNTFRFKTFGSSCENLNHTSEMNEKRNWTASNPIDFDETALSSCDISVSKA